ncbi:SDR family oxidoreductase [Phanerochaete sordida]|uniref:SDR family oxidoreductase n=1 Tax=Phanerochaete sordida TaxID=48140 RepID=A0A9P3GND4_9APHY|nr:SDR family oxidoreductase [Phanerochaete sordida]
MDKYPGAIFIPNNRHETYPAIDPTKANLSGKVVVVTGASRGIGKAIALAVAQAGTKGLALFARGSLDAVKAECLAAQRQGHPLEVLTAQVDVTNEAQVAAAAKQVEATFGRVDIVVNNAGYLEPYNFIADTVSAEWWRGFEINVQGTYFVTRAFLPLLIKSDGDKTVVNVSSGGAFMFLPRYSAYALSKLAEIRFSEVLVAEYGAQGILSYAVHPGMNDTDMTKQLPPDVQAIVTYLDTPEFAANTLLWLIKERRDWLAGRYVDCNWDMEALEAKKQEIVEGDKLKLTLSI